MSASADPVAEQPEQPEQPEPQASSSPIAGAPAQTQAEETVQSSQPALSTSQSQSPPTGSPPLQDLSPTNAAVPSTTPHESGKNSPKDVRNSPTEPKVFVFSTNACLFTDTICRACKAKVFHLEC